MTVQRKPDLNRVAGTLWGSMATDAPSHGAKEATLAALGLATGASLASGAATGTTSSAGAAGLTQAVSTTVSVAGAASSTQAAGAALGVGLLGKALATGFVAGLVAFGGGVFVYEQTAQSDATHREAGSRAFPDPATKAAIVTPAGNTLHPTATGPIPAPPRIPPAPTPASPDRGAASPPESARRESSPAVTAAAHFARSPSLVEETAALDQARARLGAGEPSQCLSLLDQHQAAFPDGVLAPEATVLRIEALLLVGDPVRARRLAQNFSARHPQSPHLSRLRPLIDQGSKSPPASIAQGDTLEETR